MIYPHLMCVYVYMYILCFTSSSTLPLFCIYDPKYLSTSFTMPLLIDITLLVTSTTYSSPTNSYSMYSDLLLLIQLVLPFLQELFFTHQVFGSCPIISYRNDVISNHHASQYLTFYLLCNLIYPYKKTDKELK